jgi:Zn-dependent peptidase ImmA (M78 family)
MGDSQVDFDSGAELARNEALKIQEAFPALFFDAPVSARDVAKALGLRIMKRPTLRQRAQLEVPFDRSLAATIVVRDDVPVHELRFVVAHEIGHAVLLQARPNAAEEWAVWRREQFANVFATEILTPPMVRLKYTELFRALPSAIDLVHMASHLGLSPHAFLTVASKERAWLEGLEKIWLRVKYSINTVTRREPRFRVASAHYDREKFFVPINRSIRTFAGDDQWLTALRPGASAYFTSTIRINLRRSPPAFPLFPIEMRVASFSAVRLRPSAADKVPYLVILVDLGRKPESS